MVLSKQVVRVINTGHSNVDYEREELFVLVDLSVFSEDRVHHIIVIPSRFQRSGSSLDFLNELMSL